MKLYKIIDHALENHLWKGEIPYPFNGKVRWSCWAVRNALGLTEKQFDASKEVRYLESFGVRSHSPFEFSEFEDIKDAQQARALWLTWVSMIAKEEGIEV